MKKNCLKVLSLGAKKSFLIFCLLLSSMVLLSSEVLPLSFGTHIGTNMETPQGYALNLGLQGSYEIFNNFNTGLQFDSSMDFKNSFAFEATVFAKYILPFKFSIVEPFVKCNLGYALVRFKDINANAMALGLETGVSIPVSKFSFEPYLRFGYPYFWGAGVCFQYSLKD